MRPTDAAVKATAIGAGPAMASAARSLRLLATTSVAVLAALPLPAAALQVVDGRDGVAIEAIVSIKEPTRIRIEGAPITDVFGNIHTSNCGGSPAAAPASPTLAGTVVPANNPAGEIVLECDRDKGEVYIRPVGDSTKPVNLFIASAHATYTLVLRKSDTPADTIVIRDRTQRTTQAASARGNAGEHGANGAMGAGGPLGPSANHVRSMKAMLVAMASDRVPPDMRVEEMNSLQQLWAEASFSMMRRYEGRGLIGEKYLLQNTSQAVMVLAEQEFDRPDSAAGGQVVGVAVENHHLRPGETTNVFVIRRGGQ